jgi:hypothetical protein
MTLQLPHDFMTVLVAGNHALHLLHARVAFIDYLCTIYCPATCSSVLQMQVVDMAIRSGCVMISLELTTAQIESSQADMNTGDLSNDEQQKMLQAVLHGLKPALQQFQQKQLAKDSNLSQQSTFKPHPLQATEEITVHSGQHSWNVKWDIGEGRWLASQLQQQDRLPQVTMGLVQLLESNEDITPNNHVQPTNSWCKHIHSDEPGACCDSISTRFLLHLWDVSQANGPVNGWRAPQAGHHTCSQV